jgi:hypothetical protein
MITQSELCVHGTHCKVNFCIKASYELVGLSSLQRLSHSFLPSSTISMSFNFSLPPIGSQSRSHAIPFDSSLLPTGSKRPASPSLLSSPSTPSFQRARSPDSSSRQPQIDPYSLADESLSAPFVDALANQFSFGDKEQDLRENLHGFAKVCQWFDFSYIYFLDETLLLKLQVGRGLSKPDLATRTYLLGGIFCLLKEHRMIMASHMSTLNSFSLICKFVLTPPFR